MKVFVGERRPAAGQLTVTLGTHGRGYMEAWALQREIIALAPQIGGYQRLPGGVLYVAGVIVERSFKGGGQNSGQVDVTLDLASPYWWQGGQTQAIATGSPQAVFVDGEAGAALRIAITAGGAGVTNPAILSDAGQTTWLGTLPAGQTLTLDPSGQTVSLGGVDVSLSLTGPQPYLEPGSRTLTITAPGATALIAWEEGKL